jgi:hypothetical protein
VESEHFATPRVRARVSPADTTRVTNPKAGPEPSDDGDAEIFVALLEESVEVWRPVRAERTFLDRHRALVAIERVEPAR